MKKLAKMFLMVVLMCTVSLLMFGCALFSGFGAGGAKIDPENLGKYTIVSMESMGTVVTGDNLEDELADAGGCAEQYFEIKDNGEMILKLNGESMDMTYTADGNTLTFQDQTGPSSVVIEDGVLTWTVSDEQAKQAGGFGGFEMIFEKQ